VGGKKIEKVNRDWGIRQPDSRGEKKKHFNAGFRQDR
jgi:hypothetical protein